MPSSTSEATGREARCCSRRASSGATARGRTSVASAPAASRRCSGSSGSGSTARSRGCAAWAREPTATETGNPLTTGRAVRPARRSPRCSPAAADEPARQDRGRRRPASRCSSAPAASPPRRSSSTRYIRPAAPLRLRGNRWSTRRRAPERPRPRRGALGRARRVLRPQHAGRAVGRVGARVARRSSTPATRASSTSAATSSSRRATCRGRRRTSSPRRRGARAHAPTTCWTRRALRRACATGPSREMVGGCAGGGAPRRGRAAVPGAGGHRCGRARRGGDHAHDRRPVGRRAGTRARSRRTRRSQGLWAAGVDAGGIATGGYASGLAQALVLGLAAAEDLAASL